MMSFDLVPTIKISSFTKEEKAMYQKIVAVKCLQGTLIYHSSIIEFSEATKQDIMSHFKMKLSDFNKKFSKHKNQDFILLYKD